MYINFGMNEYTTFFKVRLESITFCSIFLIICHKLNYGKTEIFLMRFFYLSNVSAVSVLPNTIKSS